MHGERMVERSIDPRSRIELYHKDLGLAPSSVRQMGLSSPNTATAMELLNARNANGGAAWDKSCMIHAIERLAGHEIGQS